MARNDVRRWVVAPRGEVDSGFWEEKKTPDGGGKGDFLGETPFVLFFIFRWTPISSILFLCFI